MGISTKEDYDRKENNLIVFNENSEFIYTQQSSLSKLGFLESID